MTKECKVLVVLTLLVVVCLSGCGLFLPDTVQLKGLLEDKYGEKFGVESYYYAGDMWANCYPVNDPTLLFQVRTDGSVTRISHDYYLQTVVARQVNEEFEPFVQQAFPGSFLSSDLSASDYEGQTADKVTLQSMLKYNNSSRDDAEVGWTHISLFMFVDTTQMTEESAEQEYKFLYDEINTRVLNDEFPETVVHIYFGDTTFVQECKDILEVTTWSDDDIYKKVEGCPQLWVWYLEDGIPHLAQGQGYFTYKKYIKERNDALNNI